MKRFSLLFVCLLVLSNFILFAQIAKHPRELHTMRKFAIHVPPQEAPSGLKKIYSNLGTSKTDLFSDGAAWLVTGPNTGNGIQFMGMPFTPKADAHVSQVQVAVEYVKGANQVNLSIYADSGGAPGTLLAGPVTVMNLPAAGTCCTLAVANFAPVAVTTGTQYWVVADTPLTGTGSDFVGGWGWIAKTVLQGENDGSGWYGFHAYTQEVAGKVLGTIP